MKGIAFLCSAAVGTCIMPSCYAWLPTSTTTLSSFTRIHNSVPTKFQTLQNVNDIRVRPTLRAWHGGFGIRRICQDGTSAIGAVSHGGEYGSKQLERARGKSRLMTAGDSGHDLRVREESSHSKAQHATGSESEAGSGVVAISESTEASTRQGPGLDKQIQLFIEMSTPFFKEDTGARWLLAGVVALTLLNSGVSVAFSYIGRDFWTALSNKDPEQFNVMLQRFLIALTAGVPVTVFYRYQRGVLALAWREWMTKRVMEIYYNGQTYYALEASKEIDNPDQRIAEDVRAFTQVSLEFLITILTSCIDLASFSTILYTIYPELFVAIIGYASVGTFVTTKLGGKLVGLNFDQLQTEADFRYSLIRVRENAESIAFYGGVQQELKEIKRRFELALGNYGKVIKAQRNLEFFTTAYRYLIQVLPGFVVAPLFFQGKIELGVVSQSYGAFNHILGDLSLVVNQFESLSSFSAGIDRLGEFLARMKSELDDSAPTSVTSGSSTVSPNNDQSETEQTRGLLDAPAARPSSLPAQTGAEMELAGAQGDSEVVDSRLTAEIVPGSTLSVDCVTVITPTGGRVLVRDLSFVLKPAERMLIVGESGAGKSSLLRAMAGLWTTGSGKIVRPTTEEMFFLPQRPYCTLGPLRDQITYPSSQSDLTGVATAVNGDQGEGGGKAVTKIHAASTTKSSAEGLGLHDQSGVTRAGTGDADEELLSLLEKVDLGKLPSLMGDGDPHAGLNAVRDWSDMLSLGEQQRLAFARLLYNKPTLAILDESTSALDLKNEARMFALLDTLPDLSMVSVGHRPSLVQFHDTKLNLTSKGYSMESTGSKRNHTKSSKTAGGADDKEPKTGRGLASLFSWGADSRGGGR